MSEPRVLFVTSNRIGDCVISSGVIREIGRQLPGARITVACGRPPAPFFRSAPGVERVIILDKKKFAGHWIALWKQVWRTRWDMVVDIRGSALAFQVRAKTRRVYHRGLETGLPKVETVTRLMQAERTLDPELFIDDRARAEAAAVIDPQLATGPGPILALAPIAHQPGKSWPADRWGALVEKLKAEPRFDGWRFMLIGGPGDHPPAAPALAAAGRPTLGLFGPTEWWLYGPWGAKTRTVASNETRGQFAPIEALTVEHVFEAVLGLHDAFIGGSGAVKP